MVTSAHSTTAPSLVIKNINPRLATKPPIPHAAKVMAISSASCFDSSMPFAMFSSDQSPAQTPILSAYR